jgi:hypothetical protein
MVADLNLKLYMMNDDTNDRDGILTTPGLLLFSPAGMGAKRVPFPAVW